MSKEENIILPVAVGVGLLLLLTGRNNKQGPDNIAPLPGYNPTDFLKKFLDAAKQSDHATGVPYLVTLTQGGLESNWGRAAYGNNFFGIKAGPGWTGEVQELKTWECGASGDPVKDHITDRIINIFKPGNTAGNASCNAKGRYSYRVYGKFRKYATAESSFVDHGRFLRDNPRYSKAFNYYHDPKEFIRQIAAAGYATDPHYAVNLIATMDKVEALLKMLNLI